MEEYDYSEYSEMLSGAVKEKNIANGHLKTFEVFKKFAKACEDFDENDFDEEIDDAYKSAKRKLKAALADTNPITFSEITYSEAVEIHNEKPTQFTYDVLLELMRLACPNLREIYKQDLGREPNIEENGWACDGNFDDPVTAFIIIKLIKAGKKLTEIQQEFMKRNDGNFTDEFLEVMK